MSEPAQGKSYAPGQHPDLPPPAGTVGWQAWARENLFSTWWNSALTISGIAIVLALVPGILDWAFLKAGWTGESFRACLVEGELPGACWAVVTTLWRLFLFGFYPEGEAWRAVLAFLLLAPAVAPLLFESVPYRKQLFFVSLAYPFVAGWLLVGGLGLEPTSTADWGGFLLTLVIGLTGIAVSLPLGVLLALGRQSDLPIISALSVCFIEFIRGVPLITLLFFSKVMLPLFFPEGVTFDQLVRALIVVALFASAYMAEVIRGGLQAIPRGQVEAAQALGLGYWQTMGFIVLPQALRISIPGIVNSFIALFKDTSLVAIIGLFDLLGVGQLLLRRDDWIPLSTETYVFVGLVYFICCFSMSRYSIWLEKRLDAGPVKGVQA
jgi:general L-amino acid transport system permease protein